MILDMKDSAVLDLRKVRQPNAEVMVWGRTFSHAHGV